MNAEVKNKTISKGQVLIDGKIDTVQEFKGEYTTRIILPAIDTFSPPDFVIVKSKRKIGLVNELISDIYSLRGYRHYYDAKDSDEKVQTANMYLSPIE